MDGKLKTAITIKIKNFNVFVGGLSLIWDSLPATINIGDTYEEPHSKN